MLMDTRCVTVARAICNLLANERTQFKCSLSLRGFMVLAELKWSYVKL